MRRAVGAEPGYVDPRLAHHMPEVPGEARGVPEVGASAGAAEWGAVMFPAHKCGLYLEHNAHRDYYQTLSQWLAEEHNGGSWESDEAKQRAIDTDECWTLQWYPDTPIGFYVVAAPTLEELLAFANKP